MSIFKSQKKPPKASLDSITSNLDNRYGLMITIYDAAAKSGLSLEESKKALNYLIADFRGSICATTDGELLYKFPYGFSKPWQKKERLERFWERTKKLFLGGLKFLVRAWISIVMVAYVVIFALILLAISLSSKSSDKEESHSMGTSLMMHALLRMIFDSLFWTFHPFSPFYIGRGSYYDKYGYQSQKYKTPFYEKVNRFFFGVEEKKVSPNEQVATILQEIRAQKGRIGVLDVMKVTGLSKEEADPLIARITVEYEGDIVISPEGGVYYEFKELRKSSLNEISTHPSPVWCQKASLPPFTGNTFASNALIFGLNTFNLVMSYVAIANSWTIANLQEILIMAKKPPSNEVFILQDTSAPLLLGWVPFCFSLFLFLIPVMRLFFRGKKEKEIRIYNGRNGIIRAILTRLSPIGIKEETIFAFWKDQTNSKPKEKEVVKEAIKLGGELEIIDTVPYFRFKELETEISALTKARNESSFKESYVGSVVFDSGN